MSNSEYIVVNLPFNAKKINPESANVQQLCKVNIFAHLDPSSR